MNSSQNSISFGETSKLLSKGFGSFIAFLSLSWNQGWKIMDFVTKIVHKVGELEIISENEESVDLSSSNRKA